jgi:uncharacterized protein (TIGR03435 family)
MLRSLYVLTLATVLVVPGNSQPSSDKPKFEAADVHASAPAATNDGFSLRPGRSEFHGSTLLQMISTAYEVEPMKVFGGPPWLGVSHFDITAKAAAGSSKHALNQMLQSLLEERFGLVIHKDERPLPIYVLTIAKGGTKLKESSTDADPDCKLNVENNVRTYACRNVTLENLAERLRMVAGGYFDQMVLDQTGLRGTYDFTFSWMPKAFLTSPEGKGMSAFDALEKQLGIKVELKTQPTAGYVVDRVNATPTENPAGTLEKLPPPVTEFEVAEIRPNKAKTDGDADMKNGRLTAIAIPLKDLISLAYDMDDDMVISEKWLETERFDIVAKAAPTASLNELRAMLRTLMQERFKLSVHNEERSVTVFALTAPKKPKLKESDGSARSDCKFGNDNGLRTLKCQNATMTQFTESLRRAAGGYMDKSVVDLTGLKGSYDVTVGWTPFARLRAKKAEPAAGGDVPTAAEPAATLTVFEAIDKQLGLKLAEQKHAMPVLVVDHVERIPTAN